MSVSVVCFVCVWSCVVIVCLNNCISLVFEVVLGSIGIWYG